MIIMASDGRQWLSMQVSIDGHTAEGIASLVDMSADEISSILQGDTGASAAPGQSVDLVKLVEETCQQVANAMHKSQGTKSPYRTMLIIHLKHRFAIMSSSGEIN